MEWQDKIFHINDDLAFEEMAMKVFEHQFHHNATYRSFCDLLYKHPGSVTRLEDIPFLPIEFFKSRIITTGTWKPQKIFRSSGTTGSLTSQHHVLDLSLYTKSFQAGFQHFYSAAEGYTILGLLPSYLERADSSLVYMVDVLIKQSHHPQSGFYLYDHEALHKTLRQLESSKTKTLLIGVSFALLDFIEKYPQKLEYTTVMETGGMKGRRKEMVREELHSALKAGFDLEFIHSEYGMTELLSQAYSQGDGIFNCPPWMKVFSRETEDPLSIQFNQRTGGLNIIDLANVHSCSFLATQDLAKVFEDGSFEVLGRFDFSDIRGCNLMAL